MHARDVEHSDALQRCVAEVQDDAITLRQKDMSIFPGNRNIFIQSEVSL